MAEVKRYEKMKDSGIEWIGEIPENWSVSKCKTILQNISTKNHPEAQVLSLYRDYGIVPKDSRDDNHNVTSLNTEQYKFVEKGNLVINKMKAWQGSLAVSDYEGIVSPAYYVCGFKREDTNKKYVHYLLRSKPYAQEFEKLSTGMRVGQWDLGIDDFLNVAVILPSPEEQQAIADYLDTRCSQIDEIIEEAKKSIEDYKALKAAVIQEAVTKGLDPDAEMKDSGIEWIGEIPKSWEILPIKYLKSSVPNAFVDGPFGSNLKSTHYIENGDVYVIESGFISTGKFVYKPFKTISYDHFCTIKRSECKGGDIIIAKIGANYGMCAELPQLDKPSVVSGNSLKITIDESKINKYLFIREMELAKKKGAFNAIVGNTAQPALSLSSLNNFKLVVPPKEKQEFITNFVMKKHIQIDSLISEKKNLVESLEKYKKSLIYEVVTGKRKVT